MKVLRAAAFTLLGGLAINSGTGRRAFAQDTTFKGMQFLLGFAYPNFYFHVTTAYDMLRHNGVEIGKWDFLGKP